MMEYEDWNMNFTVIDKLVIVEFYNTRFNRFALAIISLDWDGGERQNICYSSNGPSN